MVCYYEDRHIAIIHGNQDWYVYAITASCSCTVYTSNFKKYGITVGGN